MVQPVVFFVPYHHAASETWDYHREVHPVLL